MPEDRLKLTLYCKRFKHLWGQQRCTLDDLYYPDEQRDFFKCYEKQMESFNG